MNDVSPSASDHTSHDLNDGTSNAHAIASAAAVAANSDDDSVQWKRRRQREQRAAFLDQLIRNIDIMFYCQLSILYYMDISLFKFLLRALPHWFYFTPKPSIFPPPSPTHRPYIGVIFGNNILCILSHLLFRPPAAGEATRGYLLGGLLIDFVGQESPVSRWRLLVLDAFVLALQVLILAVTLERKKLAVENGDVLVEEVEEARQDHDSEERGMLRRDDTVQEDIELQDVRHPSSGRTGGDEDRERDELHESGESHEPRDQHPLDPFLTGQAVIVNVHVIDTIRSQHFTADTSSEATASGAAAVAAVAGRTLSYRLGERLQQAQSN
ncbi:MAG: hypothetical protein ALECFALPRED_005414 [Alectoria fallacina]|uniref:DUF1746 domain-containing protein n=1 Tax=Alectoria fallacina TaxID=1903189 RepID=A0A8H3I8Q9_9LECA|nr:MAG: hypothetical protein ALECFALPRED_005414 [Alectoria fallacina]